MSEFKRRVDMAADWFERNVIRDPDGGAGWGWVPDVPPNPQNTAEVICALTHVDRSIPYRADAERLIRREVVSHASHGDWAFRSLIDVTWRLRGLRCLVDGADDPDIVACAETLVGAQDPATGGWRLAAGAEAESITATCMALTSLLDLDSPVETDSAVSAGLKLLVDLVLDEDPRVDPLYANAQVVQILARPGIPDSDGPRVKRARDIALGRVVTELQAGRAGIQEEVFTRGTVSDIWRHMTLHLALSAQAEAAPDLVFEPAFRRGLIELLGLQECREGNVNYGGFRTSKEGFVTSYATTQALHTLALVNAKLGEQVNPGLAFDLLCRSTGTHHSDPQDVITVTRRTVVMNSWAGALMLLIACLGGLATGALTVAANDQVGDVGGRLLLTGSAILIGSGAFAFATVRWPEVSQARIALAVFTGFSAIFLPIIFFVFA